MTIPYLDLWFLSGQTHYIYLALISKVKLRSWPQREYQSAGQACSAKALAKLILEAQRRCPWCGSSCVPRAHTPWGGQGLVPGFGE